MLEFRKTESPMTTPRTALIPEIHDDIIVHGAPDAPVEWIDYPKVEMHDLRDTPLQFGEEEDAMFKHIMVPVDLHLPPEVKKATEVAAQLASWQAAKVTVVSVTGTQLGDVNLSKDAIEQKLKDCASEIAEQSGAPVALADVLS